MHWDHTSPILIKSILQFKLPEAHKHIDKSFYIHVAFHLYLTLQILIWSCDASTSRKNA